MVNMGNANTQKIQYFSFITLQSDILNRLKRSRSTKYQLTPKMYASLIGHHSLSSYPGMAIFVMGPLTVVASTAASNDYIKSLYLARTKQVHATRRLMRSTEPQIRLNYTKTTPNATRSPSYFERSISVLSKLVIKTNREALDAA